MKLCKYITRMTARQNKSSADLIFHHPVFKDNQPSSLVKNRIIDKYIIV